MWKVYLLLLADSLTFQWACLPQKVLKRQSAHIQPQEVNRVTFPGQKDGYHSVPADNQNMMVSNNLTMHFYSSAYSEILQLLPLICDK